MGFTKGKGIAASVVLVVAALFNFLAFTLPPLRSLTFWLGYAFFSLAAVILLAVVFFVYHPKSKQESFLKLSVPLLAWVYFAAQTVLAAMQVFGVLTLSYVTLLALNGGVTGVFLLLVMTSHAATGTIEEQEQQTTEKVLFLKNLRTELELITSADRTVSARLQALAEEVRFSDPMSHSMLSELEKEIETKIVLLKSAVNDSEVALKEIESIGQLLKERNKKCAMYKHMKETPVKADNGGAKYAALTVGLIGLVAAVVLTICFWVVPNGAYRAAMALYDAGRYEEAIVSFEELDGFRDSAHMIVVCEEAIKEKTFAKAMVLYQAGQFDQALVLFEALGDYEESEAMVAAIKKGTSDDAYAAACALMDDGKYVEAIAAFEALGGYKDSAEKIVACREAVVEAQYMQAQAYFDNQQYVEAIAAYTALGDYKDSKQQIEKIYNRLSEDDSVVYYGSYNGKPIAWEVARTKNDQLLLVAKEAVVSLPYHEELKAISWNESTLCKWLNTEFVQAFSEEQKASIVPTVIDGVQNYVFLLSQSEAEQTWIYDYTTSIGTEWWLRTVDDNVAVYVNARGRIQYSGEQVIRAKGVRPAMWLSLK